MQEKWLQKYIQEYHQQIGFSEIHGPYKVGADFKGIYGGKPVKIEAEWDYSDYISHQHSLRFADVLVVGTLEPLPENLKNKLPAIIINLDRQKVIAWARPRIFNRNREDYSAYHWRRLARSLLDLFVYYRQTNHQSLDFTGSGLAHPVLKRQKPPGFEFGTAGKEESFDGRPEDKEAWDYWLFIAHSVAGHFHLRPALLRPTWIDRIALYYNHTGRITEGEIRRFKEVAVFVDDFIERGEGRE